MCNLANSKGKLCDQLITVVRTEYQTYQTYQTQMSDDCEKNRYAFALNFPALLRENHRNQYQSPTSNGTHLSNIRMIPKSAKFRTVLCGTFLWLPNTAQTAQMTKFCRTRGTGGTFSLHRFMSQSSKSFMWISPPPPGLPQVINSPSSRKAAKAAKEPGHRKNMKKWVPNSLDSG